MTKEELIVEFNSLDIKDMPMVDELYELPGHFINLEYTFPSGQNIKFWDDSKTYLGAEVCKKDSDRCYGLASDGEYILVSEYGEKGCDAEIVIFKRL